MLFDEGKGLQYKGKALKDIEFDMTDEADDYSLGEELAEQGATVPNECNEEPGPSIRQKTNRHKWTKEQKKIVLEHFKNHIKEKRAPKKRECEVLQNIEKSVRDISWIKIKTFVFNSFNSV